MTTPSIFKQRLLNVARAVRESDNPVAFFRFVALMKGSGRYSVLGHYAQRTDLQSNWRISDSRVQLRVQGDDGTSHWMNSRPGYFDEAEYFGLPWEDDEFDVGYIFADGEGDDRVLGGAQTTEEAANYIEAFAERMWPGV